jgi:hypothetical protein
MLQKQQPVAKVALPDFAVKPNFPTRHAGEYNEA